MSTWVKTRFGTDDFFLFGPFSILIVLVFCSTTDDPLITLRYASNVLHGFGPVFNPGERVEGFTSPLHLLASVGILLLPGGVILLKAKLLSLAFGVLGLFEARRLLRLAPLPQWGYRLALVLTSGSWVLAFADVNALETSLVVWLTTMLVRTLVEGSGVRRPVLVGTIAGLYALSRPDAWIVIAALALAAVGIERREPLLRRVMWVVGGAGAALITVVGQWFYYRSVLPNTYYAKHVAIRSAAKPGIIYLLHGLQPRAQLAVPQEAIAAMADGLVVVQLTLIVVGAVLVVRKTRRYFYLVAVVAAQACFIVLSGGDWMVGGRFVAPVMVELVFLETVGVVGVAGLAGRSLCQRNRLTAAVAVAVAVCCALLPMWRNVTPVWRSAGRTDDRSLLQSSGYPGLSPLWASFPDLVACAHAGDLVAVSEAGHVGYARSDLRFLDIRGLTERSVARTAPSSLKHSWGTEDPNWSRPTSPIGRELLARQPVLIVEFDSPPQPTALGGRYVQVSHQQFGRFDVAVYRRNDTKCPAPVARTSGRNVT